MSNNNHKTEMVLVVLGMTAISITLGIIMDIQNYLLDKMGWWLTVSVVIIIGIIIKRNN